MTATIQKWGNSLALRIPKSVAHHIGVGEGELVELRIQAETLVVRSASRRYRLSDLVRRITPGNRHRETDWGPPRGKELL